jgi:hypothetical protein
MVEIIGVFVFGVKFYAVSVQLDFFTVLIVVEFPFSSHVATIINPIFLSREVHFLGVAP